MLWVSTEFWIEWPTLAMTAMLHQLTVQKRLLFVSVWPHSPAWNNDTGCLMSPDSPILVQKRCPMAFLPPRSCSCELEQPLWDHWEPVSQSQTVSRVFFTCYLSRRDSPCSPAKEVENSSPCQCYSRSLTQTNRSSPRSGRVVEGASVHWPCCTRIVGYLGYQPRWARPTPPGLEPNTVF